MRTSRIAQVSAISRRQALGEHLRDGRFEHLLSKYGGVGSVCFFSCFEVSGIVLALVELIERTLLKVELVVR